MRPLADTFPQANNPDLLVGLGTPDDAAVYRLNDSQAIVSTVDFFPPVVDDPYDFGAIAAANALSDVYAMGGEPLMAINLVAFPDNLPTSILTAILQGGADKVREAGAVLAGGHTVTDKEPKYGLAVTGIVNPHHILYKGGARPGDRLLLTKPLGIGVLTTALKRDIATAEQIDGAVSVMAHLNRTASVIAREHKVNAMTDITGYGLLGHAHEIAAASRCDLVLFAEAMQWLSGAEDHALEDVFAGGMWRNRQHYEQWVSFASGVPEHVRGLLFDPQTSGGLLMAVSADDADTLLSRLIDAGESAFVIGEARDGDGVLRVE